MSLQNIAGIFIDFINDIISADYPWASCAAFFKERDIALKTNRLLSFLKENHVPIIHVKLGFESNYSDLPKGSLMFAKAIEKGIYQLNTPGTAFHPDLSIDNEDLVIVKKRVSPFYKTDLDLILKSKKITTLVICGASTNNAVQACARDAHDRDYLPIIIEDACAAGSYDDHEDAIRFLSKFSKIMTLQDFIKPNEFF